jgi:signal transduction histidine kinase
LDKKKLVPEIKLSEKLDAVFIDKNRMIDALQGIFDNAIKYSDLEKIIRISTTSDLQSIIIIIEDEGPGIPPEEIDKIWLKNSRGEYAINQKIGGSGIGLTVAKEIIEYHGGKIFLKSDVGKGSVFTISLPKTKRYND